MKIWLLGSAGVGKSTLVEPLAEKFGFRKVNLDPAARELPYKPDFNIRDFVKVEEIMKKSRLGPNMAIVESYGEIEKYLEKIPEDAVIDTPGQLDIFILSDYARKIAREGVGLFLIDCSRESAEFILTQLLLYLATSLSLEIPVNYAFSKADRCNKGFVERVLSGRIFPTGNLAEIFYRVKIDELLPPQRPVFVSAKSGNGLEELVDLLNETYCSCGDLT